MINFYFLNSLLIWSDWSFFIARLILGLVLIIHGYPKLKNFKMTANWMNDNGFKPGVLFALLAILIEFFGGISLVFGFFVQFISLFIVLQFLVIIVWRFFGHMSKTEFELDLFILAVALMLLFNGGGALSIDNFFGF
jgi:putative oxidoreductase